MTASIPSIPASAWTPLPDAPRVGRFLLGPELGRGGMGVVHLAWDPVLRRKVALKRLITPDPFLALRFLREAQSQAKVDHPRVCRVFEVSAEGEAPYIAMQYVSGGTLGEDRDALSLREKARVMAEVAGAIHAAHRAGLIHRDLKPSNILLEPHEDGSFHPCVLDFGLARDQIMADLSLSWGCVGTPAFMSPEQARGEDLTPASDLYSLGATFYAVFAGRPPLEATTLAGLLTQQGAARIPTLRRLHPGFPRDLETILLKCLEAEPARRYASAFALEEDLRRWLAGEPIHARPVSLLEHAWRRVRRHRALSLAIAAGLVASLGLLTWNVRSARRARIQVELAQRFSLQVREVEQMMRIERMLAPHDIRPAEAQVRRRMDEIRDLMKQLGTVAQGPGQYALGRGHLVLREYEQARRALETAWNGGFRTPETAYALGTVLLELYTPEAHKASRDATEQERLYRRFALPALAFFQQAQGKFQEAPAYGEAQAALLRRDFRHSIQKCREAFQGHPWMYEAKLLEAQAWQGLVGLSAGMISEHRMSSRDGLEASQEARSCLDTALSVAPSDERIHAAELGRTQLLSVLLHDSGTPDASIFARAEATAAKALALRPGDPGLTNTWLYSRIRWAFVMMREGVDLRPFVRDTLTKAPPDSPEARTAGIPATLGNLEWILAWGEFLRGADPFPAFQAMDRWVPPGNAGRVLPQIFRAVCMANRGQDPEGPLDEAEGLQAPQEPHNKTNFYFFQLWGLTPLIRAELEWDRGGDSWSPLEQAQRRLEQSRRLSPEVIGAYYLLARVHAMRALGNLRLGTDPGPSLREGLRQIAAGRRITRSHHALHLAHAKLLWIQALDHIRRRLDPAPVLKAGLAAVMEGLARNPTDYALHRQKTLLELSAAAHALASGQAPLEVLSVAEASAHRGLSVKADDSHLWLFLARAARLRAAWALRQHEDPGPRLKAGRQALARALTLNPTLLEARAERAALDLVAEPDRPEARKTLQALLRRNPFLRLEYL